MEKKWISIFLFSPIFGCCQKGPLWITHFALQSPTLTGDRLSRTEEPARTVSRCGRDNGWTSPAHGLEHTFAKYVRFLNVYRSILRSNMGQTLCDGSDRWAILFWPRFHLLSIQSPGNWFFLFQVVWKEKFPDVGIYFFQKFKKQSSKTKARVMIF